MRDSMTYTGGGVMSLLLLRPLLHGGEAYTPYSTVSTLSSGTTSTLFYGTTSTVHENYQVQPHQPPFPR